MKTCRYSLSILLLFFLFTTQISAQNLSLKSQEIAFLDSMMLKGQFEKINDFFIKKDGQINKNTVLPQELSKYKQIKNQYERTKVFIESISSLDRFTINKLIGQFNGFERDFNKYSAGQKASDLYKKYSELVFQKDYQTALKYYRFARHFKINHIEKRKYDISIRLSQAYDAFSELKYNESFKLLSVADSLRFKIVMNSAVLDSIAQLHSKLQYHFDKVTLQEKAWGSEDVISDFMNINIGVSLNTQNALNNTAIDLIEKSLLQPNKGSLNNYRYQIKYLPSSSRFGLLVAFSYKVKEKLYIGTDISYSEFHFKSDEIRDLIFFDFKMNMITSKIFLKYLFRNKVGLRPNVKIGLGYVNLRRPKSKVLMLNIDTENSLTNYTLKKTNSNYGQFSLGFGIDYLASKESNWIVGLYSSLLVGFDYPKIVGSNHFQIGISLGLIL
jgi:hypothetical protein